MKNLNLLLLMFSTFITVNSWADTKIGIGTGASPFFSSSFGGVISIPIQINGKLLLEPFVSYYDRKEDVDMNKPNYNSNERNSYSGGIGVYAITNLVHQFELYYGAAVAVAQIKSNNDYKNTYYDSVGGVHVSDYHTSTESLEYSVKPTLGINYMVNENFAFALDVGIYYYFGEETNKDDGESETHNISGTYTGTRFLFRYYF